MQVGCFAIDWNQTTKPTSPQALVDELLSETIDDHVVYLPDDLWIGDSAQLQIAIADALEDLTKAEKAPMSGVRTLMALLSFGPENDELRLSTATDSIYYLSLSPSRVMALDAELAALDVQAVAALCAGRSDWPAESIAAYCSQWLAALRFAKERGLGLVGTLG